MVTLTLNLEGIEKFLSHIINIRSIGNNFHIDDDLAHYTDLNGKQIFANEEILVYNYYIDLAVEWCNSNNVDIYDIALDIMQK